MRVAVPTGETAAEPTGETAAETTGVGPEALPRIDDGERHSLDPRSVTLDRIAGGIFSAIVSIVVIGGVSIPVIVANLPGWLDASLLGTASLSATLTIWLNYAWPAVAHRHKSYTVSPESIEIRKGVIWRKVISVPRSRVQHTDVSQGPLARRFELGTLVIYTAGTEHSKVELDGLAYETAARIRDHLLPTEPGDAV